MFGGIFKSFGGQSQGIDPYQMNTQVRTPQAQAPQAAQNVPLIDYGSNPYDKPDFSEKKKAKSSGVDMFGRPLPGLDPLPPELQQRWDRLQPMFQNINNRQALDAMYGAGQGKLFQKALGVMGGDLSGGYLGDGGDGNPEYNQSVLSPNSKDAKRMAKQFNSSDWDLFANPEWVDDIEGVMKTPEQIQMETEAEGSLAHLMTGAQYNEEAHNKYKKKQAKRNRFTDMMNDEGYSDEAVGDDMRHGYYIDDGDGDREWRANAPAPMSGGDITGAIRSAIGNVKTPYKFTGGGNAADARQRAKEAYSFRQTLKANGGAQRTRGANRDANKAAWLEKVSAPRNASRTELDAAIAGKK